MPKESQAGSSAEASTLEDSSITNCKMFDKYRLQDGSLNYDYFYENPQESPLRLECSVVRHMLSQVKIGMDLSKITLPTFILERRSLLEMYADHFSHPQLFVEITDGASARERMLAALKWYISSFHAGRDYNLAKKPYNPILGESFSCYYNFGGGEGCKMVSDGPVPWAQDNCLAFYAEQVSHHPPISAFYAEHSRKKIICNAHILTKSRFYGLSIGVINHGKAVVSLLEHNEQYTFTFPSAYARSIVTVPYVELGGLVTASCPQTGFKAEIEFVTKSFYSNKKNKLICKIFTPTQGGTTASDLMEGEWSGVIKYKRMNNNDNCSVFVDVTQIPTYKKVVRPLSEQGTRESRFLWRQVTASLYVNNISLATKYKNEIEQKQREETAERKMSSTTYESSKFTRLSSDDDTPWWYHPSLVDRMRQVVVNPTTKK